MSYRKTEADMKKFREMENADLLEAYVQARTCMGKEATKAIHLQSHVLHRMMHYQMSQMVNMVTELFRGEE